MDARSVKREWGLAQAIAEQTQGIVATSFGKLKTGRALMLCFDWELPNDRGGAWLSGLQKVAPITDAVRPGKALSRSAALAISWSGLSRMGLSETSLKSFSLPFREGMFQEDRLRRLGDRRRDWTSTVIDGGPVWSANTPPQPPIDPLPVGFHVQDPAPVDPPEETKLTVHAILLLYAETEADITSWTRTVETALAAHKVKIVRLRELFVDVTGQDGIAREHFGFADGISQPIPYDRDGNVVNGAATLTKGDAIHGVPLGEILFGHINGHGEKAPGPIAPDNGQGFEGAPDPRKAGLEPRPDAEGFFDLGRNGSYLVVRELKQDVARFWNSMEANAKRLREQDPEHLGAINAKWIAERAVGRDLDGNPLHISPVQPPSPKWANNDFLYWREDRYGHGCPLGSHVRRANPRDALSPDEKQREGILRSANNHRILRRGRKFGKAISNIHEDDGEDRGLLFMCLNTDIARQFEFTQQTWLLNSSFAQLYQEVDPLIGPDSRMTVFLDNDPLRLAPEIETYVQFVGGDYYFLPSLPALRYLESL